MDTIPRPDGRRRTARTVLPARPITGVKPRVVNSAPRGMPVCRNGNQGADYVGAI